VKFEREVQRSGEEPGAFPNESRLPRLDLFGEYRSQFIDLLFAGGFKTSERALHLRGVRDGALVRGEVLARAVAGELDPCGRWGTGGYPFGNEEEQ
jgi:hypothetical protein